MGAEGVQPYRGEVQPLQLALLGDDPRLHELYHVSPSFHEGIDTMAALLPSWVEGLVLEAHRTDSDRAALLAASKVGPLTEAEVRRIVGQRS